ncbi:MAG: L-seryl-tRNA(Sec) selenium transferase [Candidatus Tectomicrobia bacterium RIFCSPLOWO2_12_FULL_69_37]|nr:MAG: L-seryl-tRNA(Sec) selenium transferase [Candidatus Tectomicrobia bacterium RIFCSPLOWO2_12_FULL_69_37]OGL61309.1 MAG: L-seryl-tRNA(Sec) selenium transferase [Candidatus Tectomicrobia bacterium RIFCSPLOWO2_02_FULL_70_19]
MKSPGKPAPPGQLLRHLPSVDELIPELRREAGGGPSDAALAEAARRAIEGQRQRLRGGQAPEGGPANGPALRDSLRREALHQAGDILRADQRPRLRPLINATGIVLHTNLGRAPLSEAACEALLGVARGYSNLEFDLESGKRGRREGAMEELLCRLTGAEGAVVVNNNAAAVMFAIRLMAEGREVIVSRGELIEIGGSFRIPEIMAQSGARLVEVGATNKTRLEDYESAIGPDTGLLLKAHTSNFRIVGFTEEVPRERLVALGRERGLPVLEDLGSGCLLPVPGLPAEPTVAASVEAGVDLITFSGDKLLGGPQAGIAVGRAGWVQKLKKHPMMRILRPGKLTLAALEATLRAYLDPGTAAGALPALRMLAEAPESVGRRVRALLDALGPELRGKLDAREVETTGKVGGGALPLAELPSRAVALAPGGLSPDETEERLRRNDPPVIARIHEDRVLLDLRCVREDELPLLARALRALAGA